MYVHVYKYNIISKTKNNLKYKHSVLEVPKLVHVYVRTYTCTSIKHYLKNNLKYKHSVLKYHIYGTIGTVGFREIATLQRLYYFLPCYYLVMQQKTNFQAGKVLQLPQLIN